ncbi:MAG: hypothetical protein COT71_02420 [Candidatus Andersenbacteria bacterium CG10_big_fil_rev_8_21_14_0_10_54_11]|uniref:DUF4386 domain-containing protein n=1 Tax=Candidatus Andersenbacteria bacterium CG10_big_fil_rev_8_21_14_0_10_54_11 TaxID=1974485 RepID=A0A2M6WZC2_9BACT|nr:MAG: hypothetical protein COT71_02420 [Candidatus Andersenbacteria bacterium CG10_big_fil_rev_8_21_14_0_10_54_11]
MNYRHLTRSSLSVVALAAITVLAAAPAAAQTAYTNPLGGITSPHVLITRIENILVSFAAPLVLLALAYGGIILVFGGVDNANNAKQGKTIILWALIGLAVILARFTLRDFVSQDVLRGTVTARPTLLDYITRIINFILYTVSAVALVAMVYGGLIISGSFGFTPEKKMQQGKNAIVFGLVGLAVTILSFTLIELVVYIFNG